MIRQLINAGVPLVPLSLGSMPGMTASELGSWLLGLAAVSVIVNQAAGAWLKIKGQPVGMEMAENCTLKHEPICQRIVHVENDSVQTKHEINERLIGVSRTFSSLRQELKNDISLMSSQARESDKDLHNRMNVIVDDLHKLMGAFESYTKHERGTA